MDFKNPSWKVVIIAFVFFWPVGLYLLWNKLSNDKAAYMQNSKILKVIGIIFILCGLSMITSIRSGSGFGAFIFYVGGGALIIYGSERVKKSGELYKKFIEIVINQNQTTIENIASAMGLTYEETVEGLQKMIDKGYFEGAYIDHSKHEIVLHSRNNVAQETGFEGAAQPQQRVVKCPNCGGNNWITVGRVCECDFCGSPIQ